MSPSKLLKAKKIKREDKHTNGSAGRPQRGSIGRRINGPAVDKDVILPPDSCLTPYLNGRERLDRYYGWGRERHSSIMVPMFNELRSTYNGSQWDW